MHGCGSFPAETDGNPHPELPRRLAQFGPVGGQASFSQIRAPLSHLECLGLRVNFVKSVLPPSQCISFHGTVIDLARMRAVVTAKRARLNPSRPVTVPTWDLPTVLRALKSPPFEPLQSVELRPLMLRIALLLALASVKHMGDLHALSGHNHFLVTKQRLSRWIIDTITLVYSSLGQQCPMGLRAHSTRGITSSFLWSSGVSIAEICAAGWLFICFIIWKFRPYMPESFLHNRLTLVI